MLRISKRTLIVILLSFLVCGVIYALFGSSKSYNFQSTAESIDGNECVKVSFDCTISNRLLYNQTIIKGNVDVVFENKKVITYEFCNPITNVTENIYMVHIAGDNAITSAQYGLTVPTGFLYFEEDMDTFLLSQTHPYLGDFLGMRKGEITEEIIQVYSEIIE